MAFFEKQELLSDGKIKMRMAINLWKQCSSGWMVETGVTTVWQLFTGAIFSSSVIAMIIEKIHDFSRKSGKVF